MTLDAIKHPKKRAFLAAYSETGNISRSAEIAHIERATHYNWLKADQQYVDAFQQAHEKAIDTLESEARRRAVEGVEKPVYQGGRKVGVVREYSDVLLIFLMKGANPGKYRENVKHQHRHRHDHKHEVSQVEQSVDRIDDILAKRTERASAAARN